MTVGQLEPDRPAETMSAVDRRAGRWLLRLLALPENVALVREAVRREAEALGMGPREVDDLRTVVSEACNNVVLHGYPADAEERPLEVELRRQGEEVEVAIRDRGRGIRSGSAETPDSLRLGLSLIGSLASCFQLRSERGRGTELLVRIPLSAA